ncbi:hypothetical protein CSAL01_04271 [Colletotrichum salicis]|uniref:ubiquitinyl hydrolase 1 n=1 Tax=Colletotrichum salicis TaxID=1209931 RepID=A0A135TD13_9PEZI|nr:hypothetical protein CSAL01_04271 [Colletotrichum salicis]
MSLEIMPTSIQGMQYSAKRQYAGHVIHLGTSQNLGRGELDVLVQAYHNQNRYDLIPRRLLTGKFPTKFVNDYVHWYDYNRNCVEFCDKEVPWKHDQSHWRLIPAPGNRWTLGRDVTALIDVNSRSAKAISSILRPLEDQYSIHIIHNETDGSLFVDLAKARLEFAYQSKETSLMSRQYREMSVDANQSIGTLVGLKDKLILRIDQPCHTAITPGRKVLILEGCVSHMKHGEHVNVCIEKGRAAGVDQYDVDARLGRLVLNGNLQSKLFLCYPHAVTSFGIPDPLTGKTGTEEALSILDSAFVRSFDVLTRENVALLGRLAEVTPRRAYYPINKRVMQTVGWSPQLSFMSQHGLFHDSVQSILQQAEKVRFFHPQLYFRPPPLDHANHFLLDRDNLRSSTFRVSGFGAERQCQEHDDTHYAARDRRSSDRRTWAFMGFRQRQEEQYDRKTMESVTVLAKILEAQWPYSVPVIPRHHPDRTSGNTYVRMDAALPAITALFKSWHNNLQFDAHLGAIASHLPTEVNIVPPVESRLSTPDLPSAISSQKQRYLGEDNFFRETIPHFVSESVSVLDYGSICQRPKNAGGSVKKFKLPNLLSRFGNRQLGHLEALQHHESTEVFLKPCYDEATPALLDYVQKCKKNVQKLHSLIMMALFGQNGGNCVANIHDIYQRPRFSPFLLLRRLNHLHRDRTPTIWRKYLIQYGIAVTQLQRAERMLASSGDAITLTNELRNSAYRNWFPNDHPDTLLLEIESGIMVRDVQERIAGQMRDPPAEQSAVMQLNMGEGKSSVIIPMVAAATTNGSQMSSACRFRGRSKSIGLSEAETIHTLFRECMESKGVLLIQPEHILSFKLMGFETAIADKAIISQSLIRSQQFLDEFSRNIVDESDENFDVKFELVYTMLSASVWDIGKETANPTTGFSGTNDSRAFLPLSVRQLDLPDQKHTNALILEYLLQDESSVALMPSTKEASKTDAETLLEMVVKLDPPARVILHVGAQILELDNVGVAERWLGMTVRQRQNTGYRKRRIESFQTSPLATQTDVCLVFLDEAHTRGTDLKLPESYRAAVTLGANLTKDRLVQDQVGSACMRMRKLGKGQSMVFCVPDEINQKISSAFDLRDNDLSVDHILEWSIMDTFKDLRLGIWLWANQGRRYQNQKLLWEKVMTDDSPIISKRHAERFLEEEAQTLETRYKPIFQLAFALEGTHANDQGSVDAIAERLLQLGGVNPESTTFREEQETELSLEVEQEREVQRPPAAKPARHAIHPDVRAFISDGVVKRGSEAFLPAFNSFEETSAAKQYDVSRISRGLLVTEDFARTIVSPGNGYNSDLFQR